MVLIVIVILLSVRIVMTIPSTVVSLCFFYLGATPRKISLSSRAKLRQLVSFRPEPSQPEEESDDNKSDTESGVRRE